MKFSLPFVSPVSGLTVAGDLSNIIASCRLEEQPACLGFSVGDHSVDRSVCVLCTCCFTLSAKMGLAITSSCLGYKRK